MLEYLRVNMFQQPPFSSVMKIFRGLPTNSGKVI